MARVIRWAHAIGSRFAFKTGSAKCLGRIATLTPGGLGFESSYGYHVFVLDTNDRQSRLVPIAVPKHLPSTQGNKPYEC